jgi:23S rRNA (uracil1939-C5)-methyltransferase
MKRYAKCPLARTCGACQLMDYSYPNQLEMKMRYVDELSSAGVHRSYKVLDDPRCIAPNTGNLRYDWKEVW